MKLPDKSHKERGSALALVLFFIIVLSLWLGSVALLTQSSSSAVRQNVNESQQISKEISTGIEIALAELTPDPTCSSGDVDAENYNDACRRGTWRHPCYQDPFKSKVNVALASRNIDLEVKCGQASLSGLATGITTSLMLLGVGDNGDGTNCGASCVLGIDGGLKIDSSGSSDPTVSPGCRNTADSQSSSRYIVKGSVVNLSGRWDSVDCTNFEVRPIQGVDSPPTTPTINQPINSIDPYCSPGFNTSCLALQEWGGKNETPRVGNLLPITLSSYTRTISFVKYTAKSLEAFPLTPATLSPPDAENCSKFIDNGSRKYIEISPGYISNNPAAPQGVLTWDLLNKLTTSSGCGTGIDKPAIIFNEGVYGFNGSASQGSTPIGSSTPNTWNISFSGFVFAGMPDWKSTGSLECGTSARTGVSFLFKNFSYFDLQKGSILACGKTISDRRLGNESILTQPVFSAPAKSNVLGSPTWWWGSSSGSNQSTDPFFKSANGSNSSGAIIGSCSGVDVCLDFTGSIFAPASWVEINLNGNTTSIIRNGMQVKAMTIKQTGSGPPRKWVSNLGISTNGDRFVQLNFYRKSTSRYLGSVQLRINDGSGEILAAGYSRKVWTAKG